MLISKYIFALGAGLIILGGIEFILPVRAFQFWKKWSAHRLFFLHGILLIAVGFPLTVYKGAYSTVIFIIGLFFVLSGPFILLYPEKIGSTFQTASDEMGGEIEKKLIYFEAFFRVAAGVLLMASYFSTS